MGRKRTCELPFCHGAVEGTRNKRRCDQDRNIHLHQIISKNVRKIMRYVESHDDFTANDVNRDLFKGKLDKNEKGSMYRLFQAMVRENYLVERGKREGLKVYGCRVRSSDRREDEAQTEPTPPSKKASTAVSPAHEASTEPTASAVSAAPVLSSLEILTGKLREFVHLKNGHWNHEDWLWLINRPDIREFCVPESEIGQLLEKEKIHFWATRG